MLAVLRSSYLSDMYRKNLHLTFTKAEIAHQNEKALETLRINYSDIQKNTDEETYRKLEDLFKEINIASSNTCNHKNQQSIPNKQKVKAQNETITFGIASELEGLIERGD